MRVRRRVHELLEGRLEEVVVLLVCHLLGRAHPQGLALVRHLVLLQVVEVGLHDVLDLLRLLALLLRGLILHLLRRRRGLHVHHLLRHLRLRPHLDRKGDELGVGLHQVLQLHVVRELARIFLQGQDDLRTALQLLVGLLDGEPIGALVGLPLPGRVIVVVLRDDGHGLRDQEGGVEAHSELPNQVAALALALLLEHVHELRGSAAGDGAEDFDDVAFGHTDTGVLDSESLCLGVCPDLDLEAVHGDAIGQTIKPSLVQRIASVADQLSQKDLLAAVQAVDDEVHQAAHLSLVLEGLPFRAGSSSRCDYMSLAELLSYGALGVRDRRSPGQK
mmetsp:Transcript_8974/g.15381  ORF Transcript_8974/g.15381 Transcript_8974/m.15381 type:complete len:332 (+) Transcript_8974:1610-2605(+)